MDLLATCIAHHGNSPKVVGGKKTRNKLKGGAEYLRMRVRTRCKGL
jgi:hypothetical protein